MLLKVGDPAPEIVLKNSNLEEVKLSSFKGRKNVVILFFPFVNTAVCEKELCSTRDSMKDYEDLDAEVLGISVDSPFALKLWNDRHRFNFNLLSDFNKEVCQKYGAYFDIFAPGKFDYIGVAKRSAFVVDKEGALRYVEVLENPGDEPNYEEIKKILTRM